MVKMYSYPEFFSFVECRYSYRMTESDLQQPACLQCQKPLNGNDNKKFCAYTCRNAWHNARRKHESKEIGRVINILKTNRRIMNELLAGGQKKNVAEQRLLDLGFIFRYHTHTRSNKGDGKEYVFCFDCGYLPLGNNWYMIVRAFSEES